MNVERSAHRPRKQQLKGCLLGFVTALILAVTLIYLTRVHGLASFIAVEVWKKIQGDFNEGPHIFWEDDSTAIALSYCADEVVDEKINAHQQTAFESPCGLPSPILLSPPAQRTTAPMIDSSERTFVVSDVEGEFTNLITLLQAAGVIDTSMKWIWGNGRLVFVGDIVDRGEHVTETLWFIHQLEQQAVKQGGMVHFVLGNHEWMLMTGDTRYAADKYFYFAFEANLTVQTLYGISSEIGQWLRTKNSLLKIDSTLFVHGGISPAYAKRNVTMEEQNRLLREYIDRPWMVRVDSTPVVLPLWSRLLAGKYITQEEISPVLQQYGVSAMVIGHSIVDEIKKLHGGTVIAIDVTFTDSSKLQGLLIEKNGYYVIDQDGAKRRLE